MRYTANGKAVTTFSVACNRVHSGPDGERREETDWFDVVTWDKLAELCSQFLTKGRQAYVEGRLQTRSWEGQDGVKRYKTEVVAQHRPLPGQRPRRRRPARHGPHGRRRRGRSDRPSIPMTYHLSSSMPTGQEERLTTDQDQNEQEPTAPAAQTPTKSAAPPRFRCGPVRGATRWTTTTPGRRWWRRTRPLRRPPEGLRLLRR